MIQILKVTTNKKRFLPLLLAAGEPESVIDGYLEEAEMFALYDDSKIKTVAVISKEPKRVFALKNISTVPQFQRKGYGKRMVEYLLAYYHGKGRVLVAAGGAAAEFFKACGFQAGKSNDGEMQKEL